MSPISLFPSAADAIEEHVMDSDVFPVIKSCYENGWLYPKNLPALILELKKLGTECKRPALILVAKRIGQTLSDTIGSS